MRAVSPAPLTVVRNPKRVLPAGWRHFYTLDDGSILFARDTPVGLIYVMQIGKHFVHRNVAYLAIETAIAECERDWCGCRVRVVCAP